MKKKSPPQKNVKKRNEKKERIFERKEHYKCLKWVLHNHMKCGTELACGDEGVFMHE